MTSRGIGMVSGALVLGVTIAGLGGAGGCRNGRSGSSEAAISSSAIAAMPAGATGGAGPGTPTSAEQHPLVLLHAGGRVIPIRVEVARTEAEHERGLMFRNHLDTDAGMLFVFSREAPLTFWMKNTFIPLDMVFIDASQHVLGVVEEAVPETETARRVDGESQFVLEVVGGLARRLGISPGGLVEFRGVKLEAR